MTICEKYDVLQNAIKVFAENNKLEVYFYTNVEYAHEGEIRFHFRHCYKPHIITPIFTIKINRQSGIRLEKEQLDGIVENTLRIFVDADVEKNSEMDNIGAELYKLSEETGESQGDILRGALKLYRYIYEFKSE